MEDIQKVEKVFLTPLLKGYIVMIAVLCIWSSFVLSVRAIGASPLTIADVALLRFSVPLLVLMPFVPSHLAAIKKVKFFDVLLMLLGGLPFLFFVFLGAKSAPSAYVSTIVAGTPPFFITLLCYLFYRQKVSIKQVVTLCLILLGVLIMVVGRTEILSLDMFVGVCFLFLAAALWAGFIIGLKRANLNALTVAIIISYLSFFITLTLVLLGGLESNFGLYTFKQALPFLLVHGVGVGILATIGFSYAVTKLGPSTSSIMGALSPGLTALLAVPIYSEPLSVVMICGISLVIAGVILSSRV